MGRWVEARVGVSKGVMSNDLTRFFFSLHLVAHSVHLLNIRKDHLRIQPIVSHHTFHVIGSQEVRNASVTPEI